MSWCRVLAMAVMVACPGYLGAAEAGERRPLPRGGGLHVVPGGGYQRFGSSTGGDSTIRFEPPQSGIPVRSTSRISRSLSTIGVFPAEPGADFGGARYAQPIAFPPLTAPDVAGPAPAEPPAAAPAMQPYRPGIDWGNPGAPGLPTAERAQPVGGSPWITRTNSESTTAPADDYVSAWDEIVRQNAARRPRVLPEPPISQLPSPRKTVYINRQMYYLANGSYYRPVLMSSYIQYVRVDPFAEQPAPERVPRITAP